MRTPIRLSRAILGAAVLVLGILLPAAPAHAAPASCTTVRGTPSCVFSCRAGDLITVDGVGSPVTGNAICGGAVAHCDSQTDPCPGYATASSDDDSGTCDLAGEGAVSVTCTAGGSGGDVNICEIIESLCNVGPFVLCPLLASLAPGVPGVVDITPDGDVYVAGVLLWDCPPYDN